MKTIAQIAEELNVSQNAVYKRLKENGIALAWLNPTKAGNKTLYGDDVCEAILELFRSGSMDRLERFTAKADVETLNAELNKQIQVERERTEEAARQTEALRGELEKVKQQARAEREEATRQTEALRGELEKVNQQAQAEREEAARQIEALRGELEKANRQAQAEREQAEQRFNSLMEQNKSLIELTKAAQENVKASQVLQLANMRPTVLQWVKQKLHIGEVKPITTEVVNDNANKGNS